MKKYIDIKLLKILAIFYTIVEVLAFLKKVYFLNQKDTPLEQINWVRVICQIYIIDWVYVMLFMILMAYAAKKVLIFKPFKFVLWIHAFFSFFIGWFIYFLSSLTLFLIGQINIENAIDNISFHHFMQNIVVNFLIYFSMIGIIYSYYHIQKIEKIEKQKTNLKTQLTETKMKVLTEKLHPHFLFNTLNTISSLIDIDKSKAKNTIVDLSDLLREIIELKEDPLISLEQELNLLKKYINIKSIRFYDHLDIEVIIQEGLENVLIPSMLIQPILENSFKHGYSYNHIFLKIKLNIYKKENQLIIEIINNGKKINNSISELQKLGVGIKNTINRLDTIYKNNYLYSMKNLDLNKGVITQISIPFQIAEAKLHKFNTFSQ